MVEEIKSQRLDGVGEYYFSKKLKEIDALNKSGASILNLGIGSPDLPPQPEVKEALTKALDDPFFHKYQSYRGLPELRAAFASWYQKFYNVQLDAESEILPLMGSKEGIMHISMALLNPSDEVLIPNPGYPTYSSATKLAGGVPVSYSLREENNYLPDLKSLSAQDLSRVKIMWVNYPHMPTGAEANTTFFEELIQFSRRHQMVVINDNPYSFTLTEEIKSILTARKKDDLVLELNSLSKSHNMAGWRVGALCGNQDLIDLALTFKSNMDSGMFKPIMSASIKALESDKDWYETLNENYQRRRVLGYQILDQLKCSYNQNRVGMFVWSEIPKEYNNGIEYSDHLLERFGVFMPPGSIFGNEGDRFIRLSLCSHENILKEVLKRIQNEN